MKNRLPESESSISGRFAQLVGIYSGISGQIYKSNVERQHKAIYGISYPAAVGFGLLALCKAPWFGYAFYAVIMAVFALIVSRRNGRAKKQAPKSAIESRVESHRE